MGSLDHILASPAANAVVTGADIWNINSVESVALEYSRYNNNVTNYYAPDQFRASDHDPVVVGLNLPATPASVDLNFLGINDFHGRIDSNTVQFAGTIEQLRAAAAPGATAFLSAGDNIGASLFASAVAKDQPTIDVLNALELTASAVGNHEFDGGWADLRDRVIAGGTNAKFPYLGANVYAKGTTEPGPAGVHRPGHERRQGRRHRHRHPGGPLPGEPRRESPTWTSATRSRPSTGQRPRSRRRTSPT